MGCTYSYNGSTYDSYEKLIEYLSNNLDAVNDLLFSKVDIQKTTFEKLEKLKRENMDKR
jgi:hypothetical protein